MDKRIEELYEQSMESTGVEGIAGPYMELNPEKFAELILSKCCELVDYPNAVKIYTYFDLR